MKMILRTLFLLFSSVITVQAQQTGLSGKVVDSTGAVISGASVEVHKIGAAAFHTKTTDEGLWLLPSLAAGDYLVTVTAEGFTSVKTSVTMLVGQTPEINSVLLAAGSAQSVVVTADTATIDTTSSSVAGNVTPNEVQGLPINGRNYMSLATLVPGVRINAITADIPVGAASESGKFQITMDGLQVSQDTAGSAFGQPRFSQDAISQFQIITNRFDATLGRSAGVYVNSQSKSGANQLHGGVFGYFRNDALNAPDPVAVNPTTKLKPYILPFSDQQYGGTIGGPILHDKLWYFGSYEGEHQPSTSTSQPSVGGATVTSFSHASTLKVNEYLGRGDYQINSSNHLLVRGDDFTYNDNYLGVSGSTDPTRAYQGTRSSYGVTSDWNSNIRANLVNDVRVGYHHFGWQNLPYFNTIEIIFPNTTVGGPYNYPQIFSQNTQQYRDDVFWLKGKHSIKIGAEYLYTAHGGYFQQNVRGRVTPCSGTPSASQFAAMFPNGTTDTTSWNYTSISKTCGSLTYTQGFGNFTVDVPRSIFGLWLQDDWKLLPRFTVNLGIRYDNDLGAFTGGPKLTNGLLTPKGNDNNNFAPRIGFAWDLLGDEKTSVRGGAGIYFADISANQIIDQQIFNGVSTIQASVSGSSINLLDPFNGSDPEANPSAFAQAVQPLAQEAKTPYSLQLSFGVQRELPWRTVLTADLVHTRAYDDWVRFQGNFLVDPNNPQRNLPTSGTLSPSITRVCGNGSVALDSPQYSSATKPYCNQSFTLVQQFFTPHGAGSIYDGLQVGVRHTSASFNTALAYTWGRTKNSTEGPFYFPNKPFAANIKDEWGNGTDDQRHSLTLNGEYKWRYGLSLSSLYRFGSGLAYATSIGTSAPNGGTPSFNRTMPSNTIPIAPGTTCSVASSCLTVYAPLNKFHYDADYGYWVMSRNAMRGLPYHRVDARLQETLPIHERYKAIVGIEVFNMLNHANYSAYNTTATGSSYGKPSSAGGGGVLEYAARQIQFLARLSF